MPSPPSDVPDFRRRPLAEQAADALRDALKAGQLPDPLPSEQELAGHLGVSRPTVRQALARLATEGWVTLRKGSRTRLRHPGVSPRTGRPAVCALVGASPRPHPSFPVLAALRESLGPGVAWEEIHDVRLAGSRFQRPLKEWVTARPGVCWVLTGSSPLLQRWFQRQTLPTLVLGSCAEGVSLPSVDLDYRAVGWHAAGQLLRAGCERFALILPAHPLAGDEATWAGFSDYLARRALPPPVAIRWNPQAMHDGCAAVDRFLKPPRRSGFLIFRSLITLTVLTHLLRRGVRVPEEAALIARDSEPFFQAILPLPARYESAPEARARRAARILRALGSGSLRPPWPAVRLLPEFHPGETL